MPRLIASMLFLGLAFAATAGLASAQTYPPSGPTLTLSASVVPGGGTVTVNGAGFPAGASGPVVLHSHGTTTLGTVTANAAGSFSATFQIPCAPGSHTVTATVGGVSSSTALTISACGSGLAFSGSSGTGWIVGLGALLVLVGAVLTVAFTRRRKAMLSG